MASSQETLEKRGWVLVTLVFNCLHRGREFATTGQRDARRREGVTASRSFATPKGRYREDGRHRPFPRLARLCASVSRCALLSRRSRMVDLQANTALDIQPDCLFTRSNCLHLCPQMVDRLADGLIAVGCGQDD